MFINLVYFCVIIIVWFKGMYCFACCLYVEIDRLLLEHGANVNEQNTWYLGSFSVIKVEWQLLVGHS